jgi:hypothetical protein
MWTNLSWPTLPHKQAYFALEWIVRKVLRGYRSLIVQLQQLRCNTLQKNFRAENPYTIFCHTGFFCDARKRAPFPVQSVKTRSFAAWRNRSLRFSTFFFTELLKRGRNYWKQICASEVRETSQQKQKVLMR